MGCAACMCVEGLCCPCGGGVYVLRVRGVVYGMKDGMCVNAGVSLLF